MATYSDPTVMTPTISTKQRTQSGAIITCVAGVLSLLIAGYLYWQYRSYVQQKETVTSEVKQLTDSRNNLKITEQELASFDTSAKGLHVLYDNQKHWQKVLDVLQQHLYKKMALTSFQFDEKGKFTFSGYTTDYTQYAKIYSSLTDSSVSQYFTKVRPISVGTAEPKNEATSAANGISAPISSVIFSFEVTLSPSVMQPESSPSPDAASQQTSTIQ